jgi:N-terminal acetyltransferase B complex non-catalytic subunit
LGITPLVVAADFQTQVLHPWAIRWSSFASIPSTVGCILILIILAKIANPGKDALDNGNPKQALQLCLKMLKKHPNSTHTKVFVYILLIEKVLHGYSLFRLNRLEEAASVCDDAGEDVVNYGDHLLDMVARIYRAAGRKLDQVLKLYERAYQKQPNAELGRAWFLKIATLQDAKIQAKVATTLAAAFKQEAFAMWNIYSALQAGEVAKLKGEPSIHLTLAERLVQRLESSGGLKTYERT